MGLIDRFYEKTGLDYYDVQSSVMKLSLEQFESSLSGAEKTRFTAIKNIILGYKPLLYRDTTSILHQNGVGYTRNQAMMTTVLTRVVEHMHSTYGSGDQFFTEDEADENNYHRADFCDANDELNCDECGAFHGGLVEAHANECDKGGN